MAALRYGYRIPSAPLTPTARSASLPADYSREIRVRCHVRPKAPSGGRGERA